MKESVCEGFDYGFEVIVDSKHHKHGNVFALLGWNSMKSMRSWLQALTDAL